MNKYTLKNVFEDIKVNNIYINLDDTYIQTSNKKVAYNKNNYLGHVESENNIEEIIEMLYEEGSATMVYNFIPSKKTLYKDTMPILLFSIFNEYNYEPSIQVIKKNIKIELIITYEDLTENLKIKYQEYKNKVVSEEEKEEENEEKDEEDDEDDEEIDEEIKEEEEKENEEE